MGCFSGSTPKSTSLADFWVPYNEEPLDENRPSEAKGLFLFGHPTPRVRRGVFKTPQAEAATSRLRQVWLHESPNTATSQTLLRQLSRSTHWDKPPFIPSGLRLVPVWVKSEASNYPHLKIMPQNQSLVCSRFRARFYANGLPL
jgi:hypothetical protein